MTFSWKAQPGYKYDAVKGAWYFMTGTPTGVVQTVDRLVIQPVNMVGCTIDSLAIRTTAVAAGAVGRLGIYRDVNRYPGPLLYQSGALDISATNTTTTVVCTTRVGDGVIWLAFVNQVAAQFVVSDAISHANIVEGIFTASPTTAGLNTPVAGYTVAGVNGALPATLIGVALTVSSDAPRLGWKVAA